MELLGPGMFVRRNIRSRGCVWLATLLTAEIGAAFPPIPSDCLADDRSNRTTQTMPLIRPWNFDPADPSAYSRLKGRPDPGGRVTGTVWNAGAISSEVLLSVSNRKDQSDPSNSRERLTTTSPFEVVEVAGYSVRGVPLVIHHFGTRGEKVLIFGGIHGNEENSAELARHLVAHLRATPELTSDRRIAVLPVANPDGIAKASRTNSRGVDLNRNFPAKNWAPGEKGAMYGGDQAASEPETRVLVNLVETFAPDRIISIHAITRGRECNNFDGPGQSLAESMAVANKFPVKKSIGYPTPGSFGTWAGLERQVATITLELPSGMPGEECWKQQRSALEAAIRGAP